MSNELLKKVDEVLEKVELPDRHSFFQLKTFLIGKEYTVQGQLWQVVRELKGRKENLDAIEMQIADAEDDLELIDIEKENLEQKEEKPIQIRKLDRKKQVLQKSVNDLKRKMKYILEEVGYFLGAFETLSKVEEIKPFDDIESQKNYWNEKLATHLNLKLLLRNPLDSEFVNTVLALDNDSPVKQHMVGLLDRIQKHMISEQNRLLSEKL